jgi:trk system potassium uptake protein
MSHRILANLGFLLQTAGLLTLLPIGVGFAFDETDYLIPLFITCIAFLGLGFLLNALCERKDLNIKSSSALLLLAFVILPLIGSIPYLYLDPFGSSTVPERFTNSYFESVSGFTTTGFSFIADTAALPKCILVFRSLTELMGGIGIVFLVLALFQSKRGMPRLGITLGIDNLNGNLKKMFGAVLAVYSAIIIIFTAIFYLIGYTDVVSNGTFVIDTITGGFQPSTQQYAQYMLFIPKLLIMALMFFGAVNFGFNYHLLTGKIKKAFTVEIGVFIAIVAAATVALMFTANIGWLDSLFQVVSLSATNGQSYLNIAEFNTSALAILITLMAIGGCAFSMAGGIKISNLLTFGETVGHQVKTSFTKSPKKKEHGDGGFSEGALAVAAVLLFILTLVVFTLLFSTMGISYVDSLFEMTSALSTAGISLGATSVAMPLAYKWLVIMAMTIGRVEILTVLLMIMPLAVKKIKAETKTKKPKQVELETTI